MNKSLIVYYSHSGNTRKGAHMIKNSLNADILEIIPRKPYKSGMWDVVDEFKIEIEKNLRREIEDYKIDLSNYDIIFIGTPNWGNTVATPLLSFFDNEDLRNKKIMPFVTHGGGGLGNCGEEIVRLSNSESYGQTLVYSGGSVYESKIEKWLKKENII